MSRRTGHLERPGCRLYYEVAGSGPALVFAHGLGGNHLSWWQQVAHFASRRTCAVFSHRGFPPSSPVPGARAPPDLLKRLSVPVLFITGDEDWVFPPAAGPALARLAPRGEAVRVAAAGHSVYFERAAQFNGLIGRIV